MGNKRNNKFTKEIVEEAVKNSKSQGGTLRYLGFNSNNGSRHPWQKRMISLYEIDTSHFTGQGWNKGNICYKTDEVFAEGSTAHRHVVRKFILRDNLIPYECAFCGNKGEWLGQQIALELDHINGVPNDHRLENLRFLCPNCHATTSTYCGRNVKKKSERKETTSASGRSSTPAKIRAPRKNKEPILCIDCGAPCENRGHRCKICDAKIRETILELPPVPEFAKLILEYGFLEVSRRYNVAPTTIKRRCDKFGIPRTRKELLVWYKENVERDLGPVSEKQPKNPRNINAIASKVA